MHREEWIAEDFSFDRVFDGNEGGKMFIGTLISIPTITLLTYTFSEPEYIWLYLLTIVGCILLLKAMFRGGAKAARGSRPPSVERCRNLKVLFCCLSAKEKIKKQFPI